MREREKNSSTVQTLENLTAFVEYRESKRWLGDRFVSGQAFHHVVSCMNKSRCDNRVEIVKAGIRNR